MISSANVIIAQSVNNVDITDSHTRDAHLISFEVSSRLSLNEKPLVTLKAAGNSYQIVADDLWQVLFMCSNIAKSTTQLNITPLWVYTF